MIINKSCAFQLPSTVQMQKNIFGVQKINNRRRRFSSFQSCCGTSQKNIGAPSCARKNGPSVEEPPGFTDARALAGWLVKVSFVECLPNYLLPIFLGNDFLDGKSCQTGLASGGATAKLGFHVIKAVTGIKCFRIGPAEVERGIARRVSPLVRSAWRKSIAIKGHQGSKHAGALVHLNQREENVPRAIIEKASVKDAVFNAVKVRCQIAHRQDVITNESYRANRRIVAQLDSSIDVLN